MCLFLKIDYSHLWFLYKSDLLIFGSRKKGEINGVSSFPQQQNDDSNQADWGFHIQKIANLFRFKLRICSLE